MKTASPQSSAALLLSIRAGPFRPFRPPDLKMPQGNDLTSVLENDSINSSFGFAYFHRFLQGKRQIHSAKPAIGEICPLKISYTGIEVRFSSVPCRRLSEPRRAGEREKRRRNPRRPRAAWLHGKQPCNCHHAIDGELFRFARFFPRLRKASTFLLYCMSGRFSTGFFIVSGKRRAGFPVPAAVRKLRDSCGS